MTGSARGPCTTSRSREWRRFASDLATLRRAGALTDPALLPPAVDAFLSFNYVPAPWTIFRQAKRVRAGHVVTIDLGALGGGRAGAVREAAYWTLPERGDEPATAAEMLERLQEAMERRLPRGEEAAVFLSGGLDSSLVAALAARAGRRVRTFSIGFADAAFDESQGARAFAHGLGAEHREILLDRIEAESFEEIVDRLDEPFADAACIPTWLLAREASAAGAPVAMTGDGSDALLAGDHWFRRMRRLDRLRAMPRGLRRSLAALAGLGGGREARRLRDLAAWAELPPAEGYLRMRERWRRAERLALYAPAFREQADPAAAEATWLDAPVAWRPGRLVEGALRLDAVHNLPEGLLMKVERMGRPHGVECRSAFLDREFVEWSARLDARLLLRGTSGKHLLRQAASLIIPREIAFGRKHGLMVPTAGWLRGPLRGVLEEAFAGALIARQGIFDAASLRGLRERFERAPGDAIAAGRVWQLVVFQTWWRRTLG